MSALIKPEIIGLSGPDFESYIASSEERIIKIREVERLTGLSDATIYRRMQGDDFPRSLKLGSRNVGWLLSEVTRWIYQRANMR